MAGCRSRWPLGSFNIPPLLPSIALGILTTPSSNLIIRTHTDVLSKPRYRENLPSTLSPNSNPI